MWSLLALRVCVPPSRTAEALPALANTVEPAEGLLSATVSAGVIRVNVNSDIADDRTRQVIDSARAIAARCGGFMLIDSAPPSIKSQLDVFGTPGSDFEVMRRLKQQFDPHGTLAPGRFLGRL
jgi:FAD/FMN-containing dehydrogenase